MKSMRTKKITYRTFVDGPPPAPGTVEFLKLKKMMEIQAQAAGDPSACSCYGELLWMEDKPEAIVWLEKGAKAGLLRAMGLLGVIALHGQCGQKPNKGKAKEFFEHVEQIEKKLVPSDKVKIRTTFLEFQKLLAQLKKEEASASTSSSTTVSLGSSTSTSTSLTSSSVASSSTSTSTPTPGSSLSHGKIYRSKEYMRSYFPGPTPGTPDFKPFKDTLLKNVLDPNHVNYVGSLCGLGVLFCREGNFTEGLKYLNQAIHMGSATATFIMADLYLMGCSEELGQDYVMARKLYQQALDVTHPTHYLKGVFRAEAVLNTALIDRLLRSETTPIVSSLSSTSTASSLSSSLASSEVPSIMLFLRGRALLIKGDNSAGLMLLQQACAEDKSGLLNCMMGNFYNHGFFPAIEKDSAEAEKYFARARNFPDFGMKGRYAQLIPGSTQPSFTMSGVTSSSSSQSSGMSDSIAIDAKDVAHLIDEKNITHAKFGLATLTLTTINKSFGMMLLASACEEDKDGLVSLLVGDYYLFGLFGTPKNEHKALACYVNASNSPNFKEGGKYFSLASVLLKRLSQLEKIVCPEPPPSELKEKPKTSEKKVEAKSGKVKKKPKPAAETKTVETVKPAPKKEESKREAEPMGDDAVTKVETSTRVGSGRILKPKKDYKLEVNQQYRAALKSLETLASLRSKTSDREAIERLIKREETFVYSAKNDSEFEVLEGMVNKFKEDVENLQKSLLEEKVEKKSTLDKKAKGSRTGSESTKTGAMKQLKTEAKVEAKKEAKTEPKKESKPVSGKKEELKGSVDLSSSSSSSSTTSTSIAKVKKLPKTEYSSELLELTLQAIENCQEAINLKGKVNFLNHPDRVRIESLLHETMADARGNTAALLHATWLRSHVEQKEEELEGKLELSEGLDQPGARPNMDHLDEEILIERVRLCHEAVTLKNAHKILSEDLKAKIHADLTRARDLGSEEATTLLMVWRWDLDLPEKDQAPGEGDVPKPKTSLEGALLAGERKRVDNVEGEPKGFKGGSGKMHLSVFRALCDVVPRAVPAPLPTPAPAPAAVMAPAPTQSVGVPVVTPPTTVSSGPASSSSSAGSGAGVRNQSRFAFARGEQKEDQDELDLPKMTFSS